MIARPFGEQAILLELGTQSGSAMERVEHLIEILAERFPGADIVRGASSVAVVGVEPSEEHCGAVERAAIDVTTAPAGGAASTEAVAPQQHVFEVDYDGPDLDFVATTAGLTRDEVVRRHCEATYRVLVCGFLPGFAYLTGLDPALELPRRATPRTSVPAGSVAIAGAYAGIYPFASPGGWHLLGRARSPDLFDPRRIPPARLGLGDAVRFERASEPTPLAAGSRRPDANQDVSNRELDRDRSTLEVLRTSPALSLQDAGRGGQLSRGLPPSGALDAETMAAANAAVENPPLTTALEIPMSGTALRFSARGDRKAIVSVDGEAYRELGDGEVIEIERSERCVRYLAVRGGFDVPEVLGARATLAIAGLGGHHGRWIRKGDRLPLAHATPLEGGPGGGHPGPPPIPPDPTVLPVVWGPHGPAFDDEARAVLVSSSFEITSELSRVGVRLGGPKLPRRGDDRGRPEPMIRGAIQVTTDGTPVVLGPDHAVTGGYPVIAVLCRAAQPLLARLRPGRQVRFTVIAHPE